MKNAEFFKIFKEDMEFVEGQKIASSIQLLQGRIKDSLVSGKFGYRKGSEDIYDYFEKLSNNHKLRYFNCVMTPDEAAFGFVNGKVCALMATDEDLACYKSYYICTYEFEDAVDSYTFLQNLEGYLEDFFPELTAVYYMDSNKVILIINSADHNLWPLTFEEHYSYGLRYLVKSA